MVAFLKMDLIYIPSERKELYIFFSLLIYYQSLGGPIGHGLGSLLNMPGNLEGRKFPK